MKSKYTIGEVAKIYNISTDTLRLYEKLELLVPERGENSYRYYTIFDVWKLNVIKTMKSLGVKLKDIKLFLDNRSVSSEINLLEEEYEYINKEIKNLIYQKDHIKNRIDILIEADEFSDDYKVFYKNFPNRKVAYLKTNIESDDDVDLTYTKLSSKNYNKIYFSNRDFGMILNYKNVMNKDFYNYSRGFLILDSHALEYDGILTRGKYLVLRYHGPYLILKMLIN